MSREVPEWIGKTDSTPVPPRVRVRVRERDCNQCKQCTRPVRAETAECDHIVAIINKGENREKNLHTLCLWCHAAKTKEDVAIKAVTYRKQKSHYGIRKAKRSMPGGRDTPWRKKINGEVVRR